MAIPLAPISFSVLIVAGGGGTRLGGGVPKQYLELGGFSVLEQSIMAFLSCPGLNQLRIVCDPGHSQWFSDTVQRFGLTDPTPAGNNRKESVFNGLTSFHDLGPQDIILIHDAARPLVTREAIESVVKAVDQSGAATLAARVSDTLCRGDKVVDRENLYAIQTPQGFRYGLIRQAHEEFMDRTDFTDDSSLVAALGHSVTLVPGNRMNFKITTQDDMDMAQRLINPSSLPLSSSSRRKPGSSSEPAQDPGFRRDDGGGGYETRTGSGFDVHAFDPAKLGPVMLGGVAIPHPRGLSGHSDADVGLHALTDALLATIAAGDIGTHFPPSDPQWKGADSTIFLAHAIKLLHE
ncbi:MAG TPA: 2-C-methyl-D-erythritol 4-phosphate cytidylyltransferase, partial [Micavibrio sp.]